MKDYQFEFKDLDTNDKLGALVYLLIDKHVITAEDMAHALEKRLKEKNDLLKDELEKNPSYKLFFDLGGFNKKGDTNE
jgi:hypothetical protein